MTSCMQMTKKNPGHLEFFICLPHWLCKTHLPFNVSDVTCKKNVIANQALQEEHDCCAAPSPWSDGKLLVNLCWEMVLNLQGRVDIYWGW